MSVTVSPDVRDRQRRDVEDLVIEEAKRRARRRRSSYAGLAAVAAVAGVVIVSALDGTPSSPGPTPAVQAAPPTVATSGALARDELVAHWGVVHAGWVLVYSDGRVIMHPDAVGHIVDAQGHVLDENADPFWERRLSADGLAKVRSGAITLNRFLDGKLLPATTWADPQPAPYGAPLGYVACAYRPTTPDHLTPTAVMARLPAAAQALLAGTARTFLYLPWQGGVMTNELPAHPQPVAGSEDPAPVRRGCFELTAAQAGELQQMSPELAGRVDLWIMPALPDRVTIMYHGG